MSKSETTDAQGFVFDDDGNVCGRVPRDRIVKADPLTAALERLRADNARMLEALTEIANRAGRDRGAVWARARAMEGLKDVE